MREDIANLISYLKHTFLLLEGERGHTDTNQRSWQVLNYLGTMGKGVRHSEYLERPAYPATEGFIPSSTNITLALCP